MQHAKTMSAVAALAIFAACGWAHSLAAGDAAQNSATPLLSGGNPDPTVCRVGDEYYIVTSSFSLSPGLPVYRSKDMVNWEVISHAWREAWPCKTPDDGIWAPTLRHHNGVFYLTVTWHDGFKKAENYLLTAKDPAGPWSKPMKIDAKSGIDGSLFFDGDDAWYLSNQQPSKQKWRGHCQIWMQRIDLETGRLFGDRHVLTDGFGEGAAFAEGPHLYKIGGKYLLLHAQGGTAWGHMEIALVSDCVTGPYTHVAGNPVLTAKDWGRSSPLQAFGHADLVQMPDGEWRAVFLGMRMTDEGKKCPLGRETFMCRVDLDDSGLPTRFRRDELIAGDWNDPAATKYSLLDRPRDPVRYIKVRDLAGRVDYPDTPFRFCAALAATPPRAKGEAKLVVSAPNIPSASIRLRIADGQKSAGMRETLSLDGEWSFEVTGGRRAGEKTTIMVPSCWETQGFGTWQYGYNIEFGDKWHGHEKPVDEHGLYSRTFTVPSEWRGKCVKLRFEGVMTEANVKVNGVAFPPHHSAWFPFEFDISDIVNYGGENTLEIDCGKESSDASVNRSERRCDFWNYGGIFRSVSLRTVPKLHIECVRIDARADGTLHAVVRASDGREETIDEKWTNIETWDVDHPKLYERVFELKDENGNVVDSVTKRFGFRTVEVRPRDGVYVNGKKIVVKGVNRQTFNARTGRTLTREMNYEDARLIKSLNMNAVRIAHLTADEAFLDACDELGIYVEDEFCSWQKPIRTELGREYLKVFLERDHNHPSVIFWSNGNEGGWNTELDAMFKKIDLQKRAVLHPWAFHDGIDTKHYPDYDRLVKKLKTGELFMPTEFQHGLYDGGLGAGLEDFWTTMMRYPNCVGGFLWALKDEAQWRDDLGRYDACGNLAPDGLVGPNGEEGGSCATVRAIFGGEGDGEMQDEPPRRGGCEFTIPEPRLIAWRLVGETKGSRYEPVEASFEWTVTTNADASVTYAWTISCTNAVDVLGVDFPFSARDAQLVSKRWCGRGPDRIWRNRMRGPKWGVWEDVYNDAVPGVSWERPFKGWFEAKWMEVAVGASGKEASHILCIPGEGLYMGVGSPKDGPDNYLYAMPYELGVGVYHVIPAIGNKLFKAERGGPQGRLVRLVEGRVSGSVELRL